MTEVKEPYIIWVDEREHHSLRDSRGYEVFSNAKSALILEQMQH